MKSLKTCIKGFLHILHGIRCKILVSCLLGLVRIAISLGFVWICKKTVDIATGNDGGLLSSAITLLLLIVVLRLACMIGSSYWENIITIKEQNKLRLKLFSEVMRSRWTGRDPFHSGDVVNRLEEDIRITSDMACSGVPAVIITLAQLAAASAFLFTMAPTLAWILLLIMPVAILASKIFFKKLRYLTNMIRNTDSNVQEHLQENLQNRILIRTFDATETILDKMDFLQQKKYSLVQQRLNYNSVARLFLGAGFMLGYAAAFIWGVFGLQDHTVTYGMMTAFLQLVAQIQRPIADLSSHVTAFVHTMSSVERLLDLTELPKEEDEESRMLKGPVGIRLDHITFGYPEQEKPVINDFSYDFMPGSTTVIMGETGAGKSTLTRLLLSVLRPSKGSITIYNNDVQMNTGVAARCNFMYVPQGNSLMSGTIRQNLLLAKPEASNEELNEVLHVAVADFVAQLPQGLDTPCSEKGGGLSEGQAQRIAIARALLRPGSILILDESTSALDVETESILLERLNAYTTGKKTLIWVSHRTVMETYCKVLRL